MQRTFDLHAFTRKARQDRRKLLAVYLTCGFPQLDWTVPLARTIFECGADLLELGMPFSDPLADGPTIQAASQRALENGMNFDTYFAAARECSRLGPTAFMGYLNSVTVPDFLARASGAGLCGLILPEWPVRSASFEQFELKAKSMGLPRIPFIAPTSTAERIAEADALNAPFIYAVSVAGVTGARMSMSDATYDYLAALKLKMNTPYLAGFGVSTPDSAQRLAQVADGVIVGSALLAGLAESFTLDVACNFAREFVGGLRTALDTMPVTSENTTC